MELLNQNIKQDYEIEKQSLFSDQKFFSDPLSFSNEYSLLVEKYIKTIIGDKTYPFAIVSAGSFSRRELAPYSDIDIMFICKNITESEQFIPDIIQAFWDIGLEISTTLREFSDINKYILVDLKTYTQFFETRYLAGKKEIYEEWNSLIFEAIKPEFRPKLLRDFSEDIQSRYIKYGDSPKVLEPNVKNSAGGLRDFQAVEWMFIIYTQFLITRQQNLTSAETFIKLLEEQGYTSQSECLRLLQSYRLLLKVRNLLHFLNKQKSDRFEFKYQNQIAEILSHQKDAVKTFMKEYFESTNSIYRFLKSIYKRFEEDTLNPLPSQLAFNLDDIYKIKGKEISLIENQQLSLAQVLQGFYFRGLYGGYFDEKLRTLVIEQVINNSFEHSSEKEASAVFRKILKLPRNVGQTLMVLNEIGVLSAFLPEWEDLTGFFQPGVYHCYTADEHTLIALCNIERLQNETGFIATIYRNIQNKEMLFLAVLFHDIGKAIDLQGHEIISSEIASSIMYRLEYNDDEIEQVSFLVKNHLVMEQVAFRRNLDDSETLNNFASRFNTTKSLDMLLVLTFGDLSAVNPAVWTSWKNELLSQLYHRTKKMLVNQMTAEQLLTANLQFISTTKNEKIKDHLDSMNDMTYVYRFTESEILEHVKEIKKGELISVLFKELDNFTNITVITKDFPALLSKICGVLAVNDITIHDAQIFTRKDHIIIDTFNVTDFKNHQKISPDRYKKIKENLESVILGLFQLNVEFENMRSRWKRIESKFFKRTGKIKVVFENHEKFSIVEIHSPDRLGFLYKVTSKLSQLGLVIYFAKISTKGDDIVDSFYLLNSNGKKISEDDYEFIKAELVESITQIL